MSIRQIKILSIRETHIERVLTKLLGSPVREDRLIRYYFEGPKSVVKQKLESKGFKPVPGTNFMRYVDQDGSHVQFMKNNRSLVLYPGLESPPIRKGALSTASFH